MREVLYEESSTLINFKSAALKHNVFLVLSIISFMLIFPWILVFAPAWVYTSSVSWILKAIFVVVPIVLLILLGFLSIKFKNKFFVEYDYVFVNGSIRFSKVIKHKNRKFITKFEATDIEKMGKVGSKTFYQYLERETIVTEVLTKNELPMTGKDFYYLLVNLGGQTTMYVIECTQNFLINVLKFSKGKSILDEEIK